MRSFGARLEDAIRIHGGLCVGIDPHPGLLGEWELPHTPEGALRFGHTVIEAASSSGVGIVKPQVALFEEYGPDGFSCLRDLCLEATDAGLLVIADAKRGDIGSTNAGYARAWLTSDSPFSCDAVTVSPYLGAESLLGLRSAALGAGRGLFVLAATSNPEARSVQSRRDASGESVAAGIVRAVAAWAEEEPGSPVGSVGVVLGATVTLSELGLDPASLPRRVSILAPGFGAQGARLEDASSLFPGSAERLVANVSRSVLRGNPAGLAERLAAARRSLLVG